MSLLPKRHATLKLGAITLVIASWLMAWLFIGIVLGYSDDEPKVSVFLKKYPTFKVQFPNPDDSDSDYLPFAELSSEKRDAIANYCKYRFGVVSTEIAKIEACRQGARRGPLETTFRGTQRQKRSS